MLDPTCVLSNKSDRHSAGNLAPAQVAAKLPQYLRCESVDEDVIHRWFFTCEEFEYHRNLPFVMRRDFYESGDNSGTSLHTDFLALYAIRSGSGIHWINSHPYGLVRGDIYLMAPGAAHRFAQFSELEMDVFFFQSTLFEAEELAALRECPGIWRLFVDDIKTDHRIHLRPEEWQSIAAQIEAMRKEWGDCTRAGGIRLKNEFFHLLVDLARLQEGTSYLPGAANDDKHSNLGLAEALRFCEEHFDQPLSVPKLAARALLSPGHFTELFSREIGMPPAAYVRRIRLEKARSLLQDTKTPVAQVASLCGFKDAAQFSRAYRKFYKSSPLQFRKKAQGSY